MNTVNETIDNNFEPAAQSRMAAVVRPFYWSVRREIWEHRALWMTPLVAAALIVLSFIVNALQLPDNSRVLATVSAEQLHSIATGFYGAIAAIIALTMAVVTFFYCLDALYAERRDRSILFWKSLPVSDVTTVTSKLFVAAVVSPAITFVVIVATQLIILVLGTIIMTAMTGNSLALWPAGATLELTTVLLYSLVAQSLWFAPVTAWLIFVSSWVRRSPFMWALLVPAAIALVERVAFGSSYLASMLKFHNVQDFLETAFAAPSVVDTGTTSHSDGFNLHLSVPERLIGAADPLHFLSSPHVWIGLAVAAALVVATIWMRRYREPL